MGALAESLTTAPWTSVLPSIVDAVERDPDMAEMYRRLQQGYSAPFETAIRRGIARGRQAGGNDHRLARGEIRTIIHERFHPLHVVGFAVPAELDQARLDPPGKV